MKNLKSLQLVIGLIFTIMCTSTGAAQDLMQNDPDKQLELAAENRVDKWENELSLRAKQALLMEKKFVEFAIKREKVLNGNIPQEEKLKRLKDLKILETREVRDILTKPQYDRYLLLLAEESQETTPAASGNN